MPWTVVARVNATDAQCRGHCPSEDLNAPGMQAADDIPIPGNDRISRVAGPDVVDALKPNHVGQSRQPQHVPVEPIDRSRSEEHTSELQSLAYLVCRLLLE